MVPAPPPLLPSGIVTFVFTDIEQSTRLLRRLGPGYADALDHHFALLRQAWVAHDGHPIDSVGDSDFVVFEDAAQAIRACAEAQRLLTAETWASDPVRVRMGIHSGLASPRGANYVALAVHQAVRVMSAAHGGQVLVSQDTVDRLPSAALPGVEIVPLGRFRIRDFEAPVPLFELAGPGLPTGFPAVRAVPADGHNLVAATSPFVGRDDELARVAGLARAGRLVTLIGPGGVGKTRLATEAGLRVAAEWPDGVWLVDLASVQDSSQIGAAVGVAVGAPALGGERWRDVLQHLQGRQALVLLDGCEPFADACALLADDLLASCPTCGVLATSREPLGLGYEQSWRVEPLPLPRPGAATSTDVGASAAVELFLDRARAARRDIVLDDDNAATVRGICEKLDGLPLALELAAARLGALSLTQVLEGLADRFRLLRSHNPALHERQRTMQGLLEWSDRLLSDPERACLRRLGVFGGTFSIHDASAPVAAGKVEPYDVPELVWSLVDKSLVVADPTSNDTRYRLLESVRAFARQRLAEEGETEAAAERLASWYLARIGPAARAGHGWKGETAVELANLRALVPLIAVVAPEQAQELAVTIGRYLDATHSYLEGIEELTHHARDLPEPTPTRISLLTCLADLYLRVADVARAEATLSEAEALFDAVGALPEWDDVAIERSRGDLASRSGQDVIAMEAATRALASDLSLRGRARMCNQLGIAAVASGDLDAAWAACEDELEAYQRLGDEVCEASAHGNLAEIALRRGDLVQAAGHQRACLALALELGAPAMVAFSLIVAARLTAQQGGWEAATTLHAHADDILRVTGLALYEDDRRLSEEMHAAARAHLGEEAYAAAAAAGRALELPAAAALADELLARATGGS